ncbi:hypothetical protein CV093_20235 [Oceanobacillus sp. 143]|nr:hypothetical protein CV093_20235 [Oceanobacillus sp. 143]
MEGAYRTARNRWWGYIGLEFASIYANFGSEIKVIDGSETFLPREDREIAEEVQKVLEKKKIQFEFDSRVESITNRDGKVVISYNKSICFDRIVKALR